MLNISDQNSNKKFIKIIALQYAALYNNNNIAFLKNDVQYSMHSKLLFESIILTLLFILSIYGCQYQT